jgi:hypothetical protein
VRLREELEKKGSEGDRSAAMDAAILRCDLGEIDYGELEDLLEPLGEPSKKQAAMLKRLEANEEISDLVAGHRRTRDKNMRESLVQDAYMICRDGGHPTRSDLKLWLWPKLAVRALNTEDPDLLEMAIRELEPLAREENRLPGILAEFRVKLIRLKKARK